MYGNAIHGGSEIKCFNFKVDTTYILIRVSFKRFVSETPYFIHETPKTPHITGCRVLLIVESLGT